jgi:hypothetical protein
VSIEYQSKVNRSDVSWGSQRLDPYDNTTATSTRDLQATHHEGENVKHQPARTRGQRPYLRAAVVAVTIASAVAASCGGSQSGGTAASSEATTYAGVGDETARNTFLDRDRLPDCGTIQIDRSGWTATGDDLTKRNCFLAAADKGQAAELHLVSTSPASVGETLRVEEWARSLPDGTAEVFTLFPPGASETRWTRASCSSWALGGGPFTLTREYPACGR